MHKLCRPITFLKGLALRIQPKTGSTSEDELCVVVDPGPDQAQV